MHKLSAFYLAAPALVPQRNLANNLIPQALTVIKKEKATNDFHRLSPCVDFPYKLSNKFIEDFERIMDFVDNDIYPK